MREELDQSIRSLHGGPPPGTGFSLTSPIGAANLPQGSMTFSHGLNQLNNNLNMGATVPSTKMDDI